MCARGGRKQRNNYDGSISFTSDQISGKNNRPGLRSKELQEKKMQSSAMCARSAAWEWKAEKGEIIDVAISYSSSSQTMSTNILEALFCLLCTFFFKVEAMISSKIHQNTMCLVDGTFVDNDDEKRFACVKKVMCFFVLWSWSVVVTLSAFHLISLSIIVHCLSGDGSFFFSE